MGMAVEFSMKFLQTLLPGLCFLKFFDSILVGMWGSGSHFYFASFLPPDSNEGSSRFPLFFLIKMHLSEDGQFFTKPKKVLFDDFLNHKSTIFFCLNPYFINSDLQFLHEIFSHTRDTQNFTSCQRQGIMYFGLSSVSQCVRRLALYLWTIYLYFQIQNFIFKRGL